MPGDESLKFPGRMAEGEGMRRRLGRSAMGSALIAAALVALMPAQAAFAFDDVPGSYWDNTAIQYVAATHTWMQDYGTKTFQPTINELRKYLARTLVEIYAPNEKPDGNIKIKDVPPTDPFWPYINVAVKLSWMPLYRSGNFAPTGSEVVGDFDHAVVLALGLSGAVTGLQNIHMANGTKYPMTPSFPYLELGRVLQLHYNHSDESADIEGTQLITRDEVAYSIWWAKSQMTWQLTHAQQWYTSIVLPTLDPKNPDQSAQQLVTAYAFKEVGYPYIYAGEWNAVSPPGYCCGYQPKGGFDCSGFAWWVMKQNESGYNAAQYRTYAGWSLPQRSSSQMAEYTDQPIAFADLLPGDLMFFASDGGKTWQDVNHVGIFLGNGWFIHSSSSNDGPLLDRTDSVQGHYYYNTFVFGRRLIGGSGHQVIGSGDTAFVVTNATLLMGDAR
jgi:NlpC/P60 family/S-layer homology domain